MMHYIEEAVIVNTVRNITDITDVRHLEEELDRVINERGEEIGEYDGHDITTDFTEAIFYMYGPDAETLYNTILPVLMEHEIAQDSIVTIRYGPPGENTDSRTVTVTSSILT